ncbi:MAG TPA: hypothetical protein VHA10_07435 [Hypericibacter adhaerens]|jgi:hypothetical protein|uniref:hypothetical protein n=1 Tax=Hypericibacter adhaerens TaxID=2602016 RepID=UPI002C275D93|nr:hypothetical protein [Hypericibacter adhaerens]HWA43027.1 hypothetical protein [Hypericibacter adhaerens]
MYEIDPERLDLAREFREKPFGRHSGELQRVINRMRAGSNEGRLVLVTLERHKRWGLARMGAGLRAPLTPVPGYEFTSYEEAEWTVFTLRWQEITGRELVLD